MLTLSLIIFASIIISAVFVFLTFSLREKSKNWYEKLTPFECGFSPLKKTRTPFSLRFFIVTLIFLIFDIEIALILPIRVLFKIADKPLFNSLILFIIFVLTVGLFHEWKQGALNWIN